VEAAVVAEAVVLLVLVVLCEEGEVEGVLHKGVLLVAAVEGVQMAVLHEEVVVEGVLIRGSSWWRQWRWRWGWLRPREKIRWRRWWSCMRRSWLSSLRWWYTSI
jgi:hypothetical protein